MDWFKSDCIRCDWIFALKRKCGREMFTIAIGVSLSKKSDACKL